MDTYIENLFKKENTSNRDIVQNDKLITKNAINKFSKHYSVRLDKTDSFNNLYDNVLKTTLKNVNELSEKRNAKYMSLGDLKTLNTTQKGGMQSAPYQDYCHNNITQCSDMYTSGCGQNGGYKAIIPSSVFSKLAHNHTKIKIPKNVLSKLQDIVNEKVVIALKK
tara:strand:+ start:3010 stop:3504 length:495 start_codon:yes stop_codon:yes gene_type:complete